MPKRNYEYKNILARMVDKMSEEAPVVGAVLGIHGYAVYSKTATTGSTALLLAALGVYLTVKLLRLRR